MQARISPTDDGYFYWPSETLDFGQNILIDDSAYLHHDHDNDLHAWLQNPPLFSGNNNITLSGITSELPAFEEAGFDSADRITHPQCGMVTWEPSGTKEADQGRPVTSLPCVRNQEDNNEEAKAREENKRLSRKRSATVHNVSERTRRQKLKDRLDVIQDMIPNCTKRDIASTLDEAINYIKTLRNHIQKMMSLGSYMFQSPLTAMMPMSGSLGLQLPFPFVQNDAAMEMGMGMGMSGMYSNMPTTSNFPGITALDAFELWRSATSAAYQFAIGKETVP